MHHEIFYFSLALILPIVMGFLLVSLCWPDRKMTYPLFGCKLCLSTGVGLGMSSFSSLFTLLLAGSANILITFLLEGFVISLLFGILWYRKQAFFPVFEREHEKSNTLSRILAFAFYTSLFLAIGIFVLRSVENPHGEPDAWTFWNSRARLFFRAGEQWQEIFSSGNWSFPKYPQLLPMNIVRLWSVSRKETLTSPIVIAFLFTFASVGMLTTALITLRGRSQGYLGGLLLTSTPYFLKHGASQYADVPFGCYVLMTFILVTLYNRKPKHVSGMLALVGMAAGFAAWTKEEGWLLLGAILGARWIVLLGLKGGVRRNRHEILTFFSGYMPIFLVIISFKTFIAPSSIPFSRQMALFERLTDLSRYLITTKAFLKVLVEPYSLVLSVPIVVVFVYSIFLGIDLPKIKQPGVLTALLIPGEMMIGYFFVYITTSHELQWLISTSLNRLFLQIWPGVVFLALLLIKAPEECWNTYSET